MAVRRVQLRRGTTNDHTNGGGFTGAVGEITVDTTTKSVRVHDGVQAGGFDLMRADMSNNLAVTGNINFTDDAHVIGGDINTVGDATHILDLGSANTTIRVRGTLSVANQTTENDLLIQDKVIVIADGTEGLANSTDSIGILFTRTTDGAGPGAAQDPALFYWDESADRFRVETNNVTEADANWSAGATGADLTLRTLYAQTSVDVNNNNITNVGQIELDEITFADAGTVITVTAEDALDDKAFTLIDGGGSEYLTINTSAESTTLGVPSKEILLRGNLTTLGTNAAVAHTIEVETTTAVAGQNLTVKAGTSTLVGDTNGGDLILETGGGDGTGTASMQFKTKVSGTDAPAERMRIHTDGNVGIGDNAPGTLLQLSGSNAYLTLKNTTVENGDGGAETKIIFEDHGDNPLGQIEVNHQGGADDEFGQMIFSTNNDAGLQTALTINKDQKATFSGAVEIASTLDMTDGDINNVSVLYLDDIQCADDVNVFTLTGKDNTQNAVRIVDGGGTEYLNVDARDAGPNLTLAQATNLSSTLSVTGTSNLDGGIAVDTNKFTVAGDDTGNTATKGTLTVSGNTVIGVAGEGNPDLSVVNNAGTTTFSVTGETGATEIAGTTTLSNTLNIVQGVASGIVFNSDRVAEADQDAALILVKDAGGGTDGAFAWDDGLNTFSFSGSKLNSVLDITVGALGSTTTTISATTGAVSTEGSTAYLTLKNTTDENGDEQAETRVNFQDHSGADLARIQGSHDGIADDTKGDLIFSTNGGAGLSEALRLDSANLATFAGDVTAQDITASNGTITVGANGASIVATDANTLTITETTIVASGNLQVNGNITGDADEAKAIFVASVAEASTITLGGGGTVVTGGKLRLGSNIIENSAEETTITLDANQRTTLSGDLAVVGGANGGLAATTILLGASDANRDSKISVVARTGANDGQDLTIEAGSSATDQVNQNGGDLILSSGGGDGNGTSDMVFKTKITNVDAPTTKMTLKGSGRLGLGETAPDTLLHLSNASSPTITLQNLTASQAQDSRSSVIKFVGENNANTEGELGNITTAHDVGNATAAGKMVFSLFNSVDNAVGSVLTLDSTKKATFAKDVEITGDLIVQGDTTTVNTATLDVEDAVIRINKGVAGGANTNDIGIFFERGTDGDDGIFFWGDDESYFILGTTTQDDHTAVDFAGTTTPGGLQIGSLELRDNNATSLVIKEGANAYLTFNTLNVDGGNGNEQVEFGKIFTAPTGSKIGNLTLADGSITDSGAAISFGNNTLTTSGLASLDGGINVNDVFTVSTTGVTEISQSLTLNEGTGDASDLDVQSNGTSVFKVDVSAKHAIVGSTSTLYTNKIQATSDNNDSFQMYLKDNTALGFVISNVGDTVDFLTINTTTNSELITLAQATSISETLEVVGNATFDAEVNIEKANANGIFFNSDLGANPSIDATLITIERGNSGADVVLAWDTSDNAINLNANSQLHLQGLAGSNALTIGGALVANATITMTTAGAITATSATSAFASGTTIGNVTYSDNVIAGATDTTLTIKAETDLIFQIDSDNDAGDVQKFSFLDGAGTEIANLSEVGDLQIDGDLSVDGGDITVTGGQDTNAEIELKSDAGDDAGDSWNILATANSDQLTIGNDKAAKGTYAPILTLVGNATATSTTATFAGDVLLNGGDLTVRNKVDAGHAVISLIADSPADADGDDNGDVWKLDAADDSATLTVFNNISGGDVAQLTLLGNGTATSGLATFAGDVTLKGSDLTVNSPDATAVINIQSSLGDANGDSWKLTGSAEGVRTLTFSGQNTGNANYTNVLTLTANDVATSTNATFAGEVTISGTGTNALDFSANNITIGNAIAGNTLTLGASASTVAIPGDLKVATAKSLTLNNGVANAAANVDAYIYVDRGADDDVAIRWDEGTDRWMHTLDGTNYYNILNANDTLFTLETDSGAVSAFTFEQTDGSTLTFTDGGNAQIVVSNNNGTVNLSLEDSFDVVRDLGVGRNLTVTGNIIGNGSRVSFNDPIIQIGDGNTSNTNDIGFYGEYLNSGGAGRFTGLLYQPENANDNGVWKLFDLHTNNIGSLDTNVTVADGELSTLDVSEVRGGSKVGVGDDQAGTNLTISGGASTGNGAGGSIVFKVAEASQGAGATERLPTTTALTVNASKRVITAGDLAVGGQAVLDDSTIALGNGDATFAVTKSYHKITPDAGGNTITTITGGETGSILILQKSGGGNLILSDDSTTGTANGLALATGANITINNDYSSVTFIYNGTNWSLLSSVTVGA